MHENSKISCSSPISKSDIILLTYTKAQAYPEIFLKYLIILLFSVKDQQEVHPIYVSCLSTVLVRLI